MCAECPAALTPVSYSGTRISKRWAEAVGNVDNSKTRRKVQRSSVLFIPHHTAVLSGPGPGPPRYPLLPLVIEPSVLLLVSIVNFQEWLQMLMVRLHILVVHVHIIEIPFLLKDLFCCTCQNQRRFSEQHVAVPTDQLFSPAFIVIPCTSYFSSVLFHSLVSQDILQPEVKNVTRNPSYLQATYDTSVSSISMSATFT